MGNAMRCALCATLVMLFTLLLPTGGALGQGIPQGLSGLLEYNYVYVSNKTTDASGATTKTRTTGYNPRLTLNIDTNIFPNVRLHAGGVGELIETDSKTNGANTNTTITRVRPYIDLTLETPLYTAGIGYNRRQEKTEVSHSPSLTLVNEEYYSNLGWRPDALPSFDLLLKHTNSYDQDKDLRDFQEDYFNLISKYIYKGLQLNYNGSYIHSMDNLNDLDVKQQIHTTRAAYSDAFLDKRVVLNTTYDFSYNQIKTDAGGGGSVSTQVFPFAGLSRIDNALPPFPVTLDPNPALVDGNTTASAGIDLVSNVPLVRRQLGLDFLNPTGVNQLLVWVDSELTTAVATSFSWEVYISDDNVNWTFWAGPLPGIFGPFQNRFEINFPVTPPRRYIKVVTTPLARSPLVPPNIFVTELQAFLSRPAADIAGKTSLTSHTYNLDAKTRIFDRPFLYYDFYYFFNSISPSSSSSEHRYLLSNGFSANHRFSRILSGTARVAREDSEEVDRKRVAYVYNASLVADPLRTLRNSLVFSGQDEEIENRTNRINSMYLYNTAQLYQGLDLNLNGGLNFTEKESGEKGRDVLFNLGVNVVPHRTLTLGLNYFGTTSRVTGGERDEGTTYTRRLDLNVNFNPIRTIYLSAFIEFFAEKGEGTETTQNYSMNWSPFPDGALQFSISYDENLRSEDHQKERIFTPNVRYKLSSRSYIDLTYRKIKSDSNIQNLDSEVISSSLKIFF